MSVPGKRGTPSAYFAFSEAHRSEVQRELSEAAGGTKVSVAVVAKALGEKWRGLSDEERLKYKQMAVAAASAKESKDKENQDEEDKPLKEPRKKARRGPTAYFIFMEEHRASVQKELQDACDCTSKVPLGEVAKAVGEKWRNLSDENKEKYKAAAIAKGKELQETADTAEDGGDETETPSAATKTSLPLGTIKRIMSADDEFGRITGDGLKHVAAATELFLGVLARKAASQAGRSKRRTVKFNDVLGAARAEKRLRPISDLLGRDDSFAEFRGERQQPEAPGGAHQEEAPKDAGSRNCRKEDPNARRITDFFRA